MSQQLEEIPLFPLHTVLFPYATLQLRIFEERYRSMLRRCLETDQPFGVVLIRSGEEVGGLAEPYMVGTAVRLLNIEPSDGNQIDVLVKGERRFRVRRLDEENAYLTGFVEQVVELDCEDSNRLDALMMRAKESFGSLIEEVFAKSEFNVKVRLPDDPTALSFQIASFLPLENLEKQRLLETIDTASRLAELIPLIDLEIAQRRGPSVRQLTADDHEEWISLN